MTKRYNARVVEKIGNKVTRAYSYHFLVSDTENKSNLRIYSVIKVDVNKIPDKPKKDPIIVEIHSHGDFLKTTDDYDFLTNLLERWHPNYEIDILDYNPNHI